MNFKQARDRLIALINRTDFSDELAGQFINQAQDRLERWPQVDPLFYGPRPSFMEKYVNVELPDGSNGAFTVPNDLLELQDVYAASGLPVNRVPLETLLAHPAPVGSPQVYALTGHTIRVRPVPATTESIGLRYYGTAKQLAVDTDVNEWTTAALDALIYGAAELAADHFEDDRLGRFASKFSEELRALQDQTYNEAMSGAMQIAPAYRYED